MDTRERDGQLPDKVYRGSQKRLHKTLRSYWFVKALEMGLTPIVDIFDFVDMELLIECKLEGINDSNSIDLLWENTGPEFFYQQ